MGLSLVLAVESGIVPYLVVVSVIATYNLSYKHSCLSLVSVYLYGLFHTALLYIGKESELRSMLETKNIFAFLANRNLIILLFLVVCF